jgi:hypothetical protein
MNCPLGLWIRSGSRHLEEKVGLTRKRIIVASEHGSRANVHIVEIDARSEWIVRSELAVLESGRDFELCAGVATAQAAAAQSQTSGR